MVANKFPIDAKLIISLSAGEVYRYHSKQYRTRPDPTIRPDLDPKFWVPGCFFLKVFRKCKFWRKKSWKFDKIVHHANMYVQMNPLTLHINIGQIEIILLTRHALWTNLFLNRRNDFEWAGIILWGTGFMCWNEQTIRFQGVSKIFFYKYSRFKRKFIKAPITTAADDKFCYIFPNFRKK